VMGENSILKGFYPNGGETIAVFRDNFGRDTAYTHAALTRKLRDLMPGTWIHSITERVLGAWPTEEFV
jgi:hypothetical protein